MIYMKKIPFEKFLNSKSLQKKLGNTLKLDDISHHIKVNKRDQMEVFLSKTCKYERNYITEYIFPFFSHSKFSSKHKC